MGVTFTPEQQSAIDTTDRSVLVSAAAGSGKTAVLVERIIKIILNGEADVDRMLVVTFTKAAAANMKLKLIKAIRKELEANQEKEREELLHRQLGMIYRSYISTFHSFSMRLIKEFFFMTELEPNFKICDDAQSVLLQQGAMEGLFDEAFAKDDLIEGGSFREFLKRYSKDRGEDAIVEELLDAYGKLRSMPDYFRWAEEKAEQLRIPEGGYRSGEVFAVLRDRLSRAVAAAAECAAETLHILEGAELKNTADKIREEVGQIVAAAEKVKRDGDLEALRSTLSEISFERFTHGKGEKDGFAAMKDELKPLHDEYKLRVQELLKGYLSQPPEILFREQAETYEFVRYYLNLLKEFEKRYLARKKEQSLVDFSDLEHFAEKILSDPKAAETLRDRFRFIFIDEYQDTNHLQEHLISQIARPDNLFKVGDIKHSIYRFRQSEPQIFRDTFRRYDDPACSEATTINLNRNFRSNGKTIRYINDVFSAIMDGYDENAALVQGLPGHSEYDLKPEIHLLVEEKQESGAEEEEGSGERSRVDAEAQHVAEVIEKLLGTEFHDGKTGVVRKVEQRDIVILMRSTKFGKGDAYHKALAERDISAHVSVDGGYFDTIEVAVAMALLSVIDNMRQDVPLLAVLRSEIFGFSAQELGEIRAFCSSAEAQGSGLSRRHPFVDAFRYYGDHGDKEELRSRVSEVIRKIGEWRERSSVLPLDDYIWYLLTDSRYYLCVGAMHGGRQRQANLRVLTERAGAFREEGIASLGGFIRYLEILRKKDVKAGQAMMVSEEDDLVRIMTIHKSKGLEFPFVIVTGLGGRFNAIKSKNGLFIDPKIGVGLAYVDPKQRFWRLTVQQRLILDKIREEDLEEEQRVLYVAMTRAREKLILVGSEKKKEKEKTRADSSSFLGLMREVLQPESVEYREYVSEQRNTFAGKSDLTQFLREIKTIPEVDAAASAEVARRLNYRYAHESALRAKVKYSVTELRRAALQNEQRENAVPELRHAVKTGAPRGIGAAELGTAYHRVMEFLDFRRVLPASGVCDRAYIEACAETLHKRGAIATKIYEALDLGRIEAFFAGELGRRAAEAAQRGCLAKETPFTLRREHEGEAVLVQGIIDCWFEEEDGLVLVDYKSNRIPRNGTDALERIKDEYRRQIALYREALEEGRKRSVKEAYLYLFDAGTLLAIKA